MVTQDEFSDLFTTSSNNCHRKCTGTGKENLLCGLHKVCSHSMLRSSRGFKRPEIVIGDKIRQGQNNNHSNIPEQLAKMLLWGRRLCAIGFLGNQRFAIGDWK